MAKLSRALRFSAKVKIERQVLALVNTSALSTKHKLPGMTEEAILTWEANLEECVKNKQLVDVVHKLKEISRNAHIINDTSRAVFDKGLYFNNVEYKQNLNELSEILNHIYRGV